MTCGSRERERGTPYADRREDILELIDEGDQAGIVDIDPTTAPSASFCHLLVQQAHCGHAHAFGFVCAIVGKPSGAGGGSGCDPRPVLVRTGFGKCLGASRGAGSGGYRGIKCSRRGTCGTAAQGEDVISHAIMSQPTGEATAVAQANKRACLGSAKTPPAWRIGCAARSAISGAARPDFLVTSASLRLTRGASFVSLRRLLSPERGSDDVSSLGRDNIPP